jgi:hypothetical protein
MLRQDRERRGRQCLARRIERRAVRKNASGAGEHELAQRQGLRIDAVVGEAPVERTERRRTLVREMLEIALLLLE